MIEGNKRKSSSHKLKGGYNIEYSSEYQQYCRDF